MAESYLKFYNNNAIANLLQSTKLRMYATTYNTYMYICSEKFYYYRYVLLKWQFCILLPYRCWKVDLIQQTLCVNFSLTTDDYIYGYTSYANLLYFVTLQHVFESAIDFKYKCNQLTAYYFCNSIFPPCDFTSGAPRAICAESCHYIRTICATPYTATTTVLKHFGYTISDSCENTLELLQNYFDFPCSSSSLQNGCIDLLGNNNYVNVCVHVWSYKFLVILYGN